MEQEEIKFLSDNHCEDTEQDNGGNKDLYLEGVENNKKEEVHWNRKWINRELLQT